MWSSLTVCSVYYLSICYFCANDVNVKCKFLTALSFWKNKLLENQNFGLCVIDSLQESSVLDSSSVYLLDRRRHDDRGFFSVCAWHVWGQALDLAEPCFTPAPQTNLCWLCLQILSGLRVARSHFNPSDASAPHLKCEKDTIEVSVPFSLPWHLKNCSLKWTCVSKLLI